MKNSNELKNRIKSVKETSQITKAMNLISIIKMRRALAKFEANKAYAQNIEEAIKEIFALKRETENIYFKKRPGNKTAYIVIASDRGLAGGYNSDVLSLASEDMKDIKIKHIYSLGVVAYEHFEKRDIIANSEYLDVMKEPILANARKIMYNMIELYKDGEVDIVKIVYTKSISLNEIAPVVKVLLPITVEEDEVTLNYKNDSQLEYAEDSNRTLSVIVKQYLLQTIYSALLQSEVAEHYHRMVAMDNATRNSSEILDKLKLTYNKIRQEKITTEITETASSRIRTD